MLMLIVLTHGIPLDCRDGLHRCRQPPSSITFDRVSPEFIGSRSCVVLIHTPELSHSRYKRLPNKIKGVISVVISGNPSPLHFLSFRVKTYYCTTVHCLNKSPRVQTLESRRRKKYHITGFANVCFSIGVHISACRPGVQTGIFPEDTGVFCTQVFGLEGSGAVFVAALGRDAMMQKHTKHT